MRPEVYAVDLPIGWAIFALLGLALVWITAMGFRKAFYAGETGKGREETEDWSVPAVDSPASGNSPLHSWDPRLKIVSVLSFIFCVASLSRLPFAGVALLLSASAAAVARVSFHRVVGRLAAMATFLGMILVVMPLTVPVKQGDLVVILNGLSFLPFNARGFESALLICLKAVGIAFLVDPLLATSPVLTTAQALAGLGVPAAACQMFLLTHRYAFVFQQEAKRMNTGLRVRGFRNETGMETLRTMGNFLGMLFVRSFERTQRVYEAMLARGFNSTSVGMGEFHACRRDWIQGFLWILAGFTLVGLDRFWTSLPFILK